MWYASHAKRVSDAATDAEECELRKDLARRQLFEVMTHIKSRARRGFYDYEGMFPLDGTERTSAVLDRMERALASYGYRVLASDTDGVRTMVVHW